MQLGLAGHLQPGGYAARPDDAIAYVDAHDNETLFDALALKLPRDDEHGRPRAAEHGRAGHGHA